MAHARWHTAKPVVRSDKLRGRAGSRDTSSVRTPSHETALCNEMCASPPPYFATKRSKLVHGMKSMTCENRFGQSSQQRSRSKKIGKAGNLKVRPSKIAKSTLTRLIVVAYMGPGWWL